MQRRFPRRLIALATLLTLAWTSLWPAVSSAHAAMSGEAVMLCHQAGEQVDPAMPTREPGKTHCPLCLMAFYGAPAVEIAVAPVTVFSTLVHTPDAGVAHASDVAIHLPQGRAPPR